VSIFSLCASLLKIGVILFGESSNETNSIDIGDIRIILIVHDVNLQRRAALKFEGFEGDFLAGEIISSQGQLLRSWRVFGIVEVEFGFVGIQLDESRSAVVVLFVGVFFRRLEVVCPLG